MIFTNRAYDIVNRIQRWLPAIGIFYLGIAGIWGLPGGDQVNETVIRIAALLAATLEVSSADYYRRGDAPQDALRGPERNE